jgi:beta-galactosidase
MRTVTSLNFDWKFIMGDKEEYSFLSYDDSLWESVNIPHTMKLIDFHYFDDSSVARVGWYRKRVSTHLFRGAQRNIVKFEAVATRATLYINGIFVAQHDGAFTPFEIEIPTQFIKSNDTIVIAVRCDSREALDIPPYGHVIDYIVPGGIYREVSICTTSCDYIEDVFTYSKMGKNLDSRHIYSEILLSELRDDVSQYLVIQSLIDSNNQTISQKSFLVEQNKIASHWEVQKVSLWSLENPILYRVNTRLLYRGEEIDSFNHHIGFRDIVFTGTGCYLNGKKIVLRGLNRHQLYPYVGFAMPESQQIEDANFLKYTLQLNIVRTSHYPQSPHFLRRCDEIGLLVFTELPGWQHIGESEAWRQSALDQLKELILRDRNHPSVILYGVRINESQDDDELYEKTNELAHFFDPSRQTAGVRNITHSNLLEDVYTYNDFSQPNLQEKGRVTGDKKVPYMVSEHTGHMFPVRFEENEAKHNQLALYHAAKLQSLYKSKDISGAIGWCMSDYYTHHQFGPGDNVCHHGVSDQFRLLKSAGYLYASQGDNPIVLYPSSDFSLGKYPAHAIDPIYIYTNCDSIKLYYNDSLVGEYLPDTRDFPNLPHPPIIIPNSIGNLIDNEPNFSPSEKKIIRNVLVSMQHKNMNLSLTSKLAFFYLMKKKHLTYNDALTLVETYLLQWNSLNSRWKIEGVVGTQVVTEVLLESFKSSSLELLCDERPLVESQTYDVKVIKIRHVDQNGQILRLSNEAVMIELDPIFELIGPKIISLRGGQGAFYVKSRHQEGDGTISVTSSSSLHSSLKLQVIVS